MNLRIALKSLKITEPIVINDSLPFGSDNMDTLNMPEADLQSMADRFNAEIHEEPNMESGSTDVTLMFQLFVYCFCVIVFYHPGDIFGRFLDPVKVLYNPQLYSLYTPKAPFDFFPRFCVECSLG